MQAMPHTYRTDDDRFDVIRPLIACAESDLQEYSNLREFPILPCNLCGSQSGLQRVKMGELLNQLEAQIPNVRDVMLAAIGNVRVTHLLDKSLLDRLDNKKGSAPKSKRTVPVESILDEAVDLSGLIQIQG